MTTPKSSNSAPKIIKNTRPVLLVTQANHQKSAETITVPKDRHLPVNGQLPAQQRTLPAPQFNNNQHQKINEKQSQQRPRTALICKPNRKAISFLRNFSNYFMLNRNFFSFWTATTSIKQWSRKNQSVWIHRFSSIDQQQLFCTSTVNFFLHVLRWSTECLSNRCFFPVVLQSWIQSFNRH